MNDWVDQLIDQKDYKPTNQPIIELIIWPIIQSLINQPSNESTNQLTIWLVNRSFNKSIDQSVDQPLDQTISWSTTWLINRSTNQSIPTPLTSAGRLVRWAAYNLKAGHAKTLTHSPMACHKRNLPKFQHTYHLLCCWRGTGLSKEHQSQLMDRPVVYLLKLASCRRAALLASVPYATLAATWHTQKCWNILPCWLTRDWIESGLELTESGFDSAYDWDWFCVFLPEKLQKRHNKPSKHLAPNPEKCWY